MPRTSAACQRCRRRKQKCDLKYPNCSNCEVAGVSCLTFDIGKRAEIPRNYVSHLEAQVKRLTHEIRELRTPAHHLPTDIEQVTSLSDGTSTSAAEPGASGETSNHVQDLVKSVRNAVVEPSRQARFLGPSSGITLARMVMASIRTDALISPLPTPDPVPRKEQSPDVPGTSTPPAEASLPPRNAANHLVDVYFQYRTPHLPIIQESQVKKSIDNAYLCIDSHQPLDRVAEHDIFTTYMVLAIALCNVPSPSGGVGRPLQSEGCFRSAIRWIERVITYSRSDLETLRAVLLLAQFVSMCPWSGSLWHLSGIALRLCVDMGLHWESEEQALTQDKTLLYERRRLWYSAYQFDRILGITLGRPFGIADEDTNVPLPSPWAISLQRLGSPETSGFDTHHARAHNHLFSMAQLESEIKHVQHSQTWSLKVSHPRPNYKLWLLDIQPRLQEWIGTIPDPAMAHPLSIFAHRAFWEARYNNAVLLLHRPNSTAQHSSSETLSISFDASCKLIASIKMLQRDGRLDVLWKAVNDLFMAGLTVIYCVWQSASLRSLYPVSKVIATLQSCASTLSAMSQNFAGAIGCRDAFDTLSTATVDWLVTSDVEETNRTKAMFEKQVVDLLENLQPPRGQVGGASENGARNISTMLSGDNFGFGEMLSSAAQWPEFDPMEFDDFNFGAVEGPGFDLRSFALVQ